MENEKILELVDSKKFTELKNYLQDFNEIDIANEIEKIKHPDVLVKVFRLLKKDIAAEVFTHLSVELQKHIIESISNQELITIMDELYMDDAIDIIESMPANVVKKILEIASKEKREEINRFLGYKEKTAGSLMTSEYLHLKENMTVADCFQKIKKLANDMETINTCYVTDDKKTLIGVVSIRDIIVADSDSVLKNIIKTNIISVATDTPQEEVSLLFKRYDKNELPVVDFENRMVGLITIDDIIDVIDEESTEDFQIMAGITPSEEKYLDTSVVTHTKNRIIWLTLLMISAVFTGMLLSSFESILSSEIALVAFLPLLMGLAGNCGSQSSTLMIRGMSLNEISMKDYFSVFVKEVRISSLIGIFLAIFNFARVWIQYENITFAIIISLTIIFVVFIANIIGFTMPLVAKRLKLDPAVMAAPIITTILDCVVILIFFSIASSFIAF